MERVLAQASGTSFSIQEIFSPAKSIPNVATLVNVLLKNALVIAGVFCLVLLILGGFSFIVSAGGDAKAKEKGKNTITSALMGLVLVIAAYWIIQIIEILTGIKILNSGL